MRSISMQNDLGYQLLNVKSVYLGTDGLPGEGIRQDQVRGISIYLLRDISKCLAIKLYG